MSTPASDGVPRFDVRLEGDSECYNRKLLTWRAACGTALVISREQPSRVIVIDRGKHGASNDAGEHYAAVYQHGLRLGTCGCDHSY